MTGLHTERRMMQLAAGAAARLWLHRHSAAAGAGRGGVETSCVARASEATRHSPSIPSVLATELGGAL
jgi:hypothetical protein